MGSLFVRLSVFKGSKEGKGKAPYMEKAIIQGYVDHIIFENPENGYTNGNAFGHFAFGVDSMDEFTKKLHSMGYEYLYEPYYMEEAGSTIAFIKDPDGNEIEIIAD